MILFICSIVMIICGILFLVLPADKLIKEEKLKNGQTKEDAVKTYRRSAILFIIVGIIFLLV